jgi:hypothetical protein
MLKINLTASSDGDVALNGLTLMSYDLGAGTNIDNVTLYNNNLKLASAKDVNSNSVAAFNLSTPLNIPAGTTK